MLQPQGKHKTGTLGAIKKKMLELENKIKTKGMKGRPWNGQLQTN